MYESKGNSFSQLDNVHIISEVIVFGKALHSEFCELLARVVEWIAPEQIGPDGGAQVWIDAGEEDCLQQRSNHIIQV